MEEWKNGEAPAASPVEGALKPGDPRGLVGSTSEGHMTWAPRQDSCVSGEAPAASPVEGALSPAAKRAKASVSGEAPAASPVEGALSPINCVLHAWTDTK
jgi:hypothetical protein